MISITDNFFLSQESFFEVPQLFFIFIKLSQVECVSHPPPFFHQPRSLFSWLARTSSMKWTWEIEIIGDTFKSIPQSWQSADSPPQGWPEIRRHLCSTVESFQKASPCPSPPPAHTSPSPPCSTFEVEQPLLPTGPCQTSAFCPQAFWQSGCRGDSRRPARSSTSSELPLTELTFEKPSGRSASDWKEEL